MPPKSEITKNPDKIYSVAELNTLADSALSSSVGEVWVRGEVSGLKLQASGHVYFSLKDDAAVVSVAIFKPVAMRLSVKLTEGKQILLFGSVGLYVPRGSFQMVGRFVLDEGAGRLQQEFERLKRQLEAEGLFSSERKIDVPRLPSCVAFVTSPTGAVWQDFTEILRRRDWRGRAILFPCRVQGDLAPTEIAAQLAAANAHPDVQLIVVGRGGGSLEDLWAYNTELVVRAVAALQRPVISAVGHQTDVTLCDFAADLRAETPSAAAELIAGYFNDARASVEVLSDRLRRLASTTIQRLMQRLDDLAARLQGRAPRLLLLRGRDRLAELHLRLRQSSTAHLLSASQRLSTLSARLVGLDPARTLSRGYIMLQDARGQLVTRASMVVDGQPLQAHFCDGIKTLRS